MTFVYLRRILLIHFCLYYSAAQKAAQSNVFRARFRSLKSNKVLYGDLKDATAISTNTNIIHFNGIEIDSESYGNFGKSGENSTATLLRLVSFGDNYFHNRDSKEMNHLKYTPLNKVRGCIADVKVKVAISEDNEQLFITGGADSKIAQGMLALICQKLSGQSVSHILNLSSTTIIKEWGLSSLNLPPGRMNGFENMLLTVQNLASNALNGTTDLHESDSRSSNDSSNITIFPDQASHSNEVAVLLSGGVDSSVALKLLLQQGHKVRAFYLKIWLEDELAHLNECPWEEDLAYAINVCEQLNVPLETLSLQKEYWNEVVQYTLTEAKSGRTPNPDIMCNSQIKFGMFYKYVGQYYSKIATGHYAQVRKKRNIEFKSYDNHNKINSEQINDFSGTNTNTNDEYELFCSPDPVKDQTYFLCNLSHEQLSKALFPIGHLKKSEVRKLAEDFDLPTRHRKDSQGICFLGKLKFEDFIGHYLGKDRGPIKDYVTGNVVGAHQGLWFHTVGQRKGLGPYMNHGTLHLGPWFVADKDPDTNTLFVTNNLTVIEKPRIEFTLDHMNWISRHGPPSQLLQPPYRMKLKLKLRHGTTFTEGGDVRLSESFFEAIPKLHNFNSSDNSSGNRIFETTRSILTDSPTQVPTTWDPSVKIHVKLSEKDKGLACGQFAALYLEDVCLGAGVICSTARD